MGLIDFCGSLGRASQALPNIDADFEMACLWLFIEAYKLMKHEAVYELNWKETRFSAHLVGHMRKLRDQKDINLRIDPESYLYRKEILEGFEDPDTAARIDIKISGGWVQEDIYYGIEGKILVEIDWLTRKEYDLRDYYIKGLDRFVSGRYAPRTSRGCMAGYIVNGQPAKISEKINQLLKFRGRNDECLVGQHDINGCPDCYHSEHIRRTDGHKLELYHIYLAFC